MTPPPPVPERAHHAEEEQKRQLSAGHADHLRQAMVSLGSACMRGPVPSAGQDQAGVGNRPPVRSCFLMDTCRSGNYRQTLPAA
jgi:hypothetical protein